MVIDRSSRLRRELREIPVPMTHNVLVIIVAIVAGTVSAVTGFGIGSLLTPFLAMSVGTRTAVAAVSIPHVVGTAVRFWLLQHDLDRRVLWSFGLTSAAGGLAGATLYSLARAFSTR
jgi:uncharacterized membrane protein YfcA